MDGRLVAYENYVRWKMTPNVGRPVVTVVIPTYNEEARIVPTIGATASHLSDLGFEWDMIISDDGSTDGTRDLIAAHPLANVRVLEAPHNAGKGAAVRRGMLAATGEFILFMDADSSTPIEQLSRLLDPLRSGSCDVAIGSRHADGSQVRHRSPYRAAFSAGLLLAAKATLRTGVRDTQCGFKVFTHDAARRLFDAQTLHGFPFDLEVLFLARRMGYRVVEVPVTWYDAPGSRVSAQREVGRFVADIARIRLNDRRGVYGPVG